ncbi:methylglyoxal synthase [Alistipes sp.]|uniref:methylglyoxal synthase n=1 Tax=Alistipes sp. TaxID=1872444 RepID=UPI0034501A93
MWPNGWTGTVKNSTATIWSARVRPERWSRKHCGITRKKHDGEEEIEEILDLKITLLKSGPLGGDQQLGSLIADGKINALIFFWDPMSAQPHDVDVKALLRLATLYNVPTAINRSSADFLISSPLFEDDEYVPVVKDYKAYVERVLK